jgi:hypothetical protein
VKKVQTRSNERDTERVFNFDIDHMRELKGKSES